MSARIQPELLDKLGQSDPLIQVVLQLQENVSSHAPPEQVEKVARDVLQRAATEVGHSAGRANVLRNLGTIIVEATPAFVRSLIDQPEIASAMLNQTAEGVFIPPTKRRPA